VVQAPEKDGTTLNKFEKFKAEKDGLAIKDELDHFAQIGWEAMDKTDLEHRLKWVGVFYRPVTPGKFMMRLRVPNGIISSEQMRVLGEIVQRYGDDGNADITTRQNLQLRGIRIEDIPDIFQRLKSVGMTSVQSGMDNVRNITGSPMAGLDADELIDTRELVQKVQDMITNYGQGNYQFSNLPRKFNIAIEGGRDNSVHAEINDIAFVPAYKEEELGFNVVVGGFFSAKRCEAAIPMNVWVRPNQEVVDLCRGILEVYRDNGLRSNRQKSRLMWLIDEWGIEEFRTRVANHLGYPLATAAEKDAIDWEKRDHLGVFPQKQEGLSYIGLCVPVGRLFADDMLDLARIAEVYGSGELRLTVEQNVIIPNIAAENMPTLLTEPLLANQLDAELNIPRGVRMHWTGCPNSCGQPQVADIGLMGTKARKDGKTVEGVDLYMGGKVGKDAHLGSCVQKGIPCEDLKSVLTSILIEQFGATPKG